MALIIDTSLCVGCGACVDGCPNGALELRDGVAAVEENACKIALWEPLTSPEKRRILVM